MAAGFGPQQHAPRWRKAPPSRPEKEAPQQPAGDLEVEPPDFECQMLATENTTKLLSSSTGLRNSLGCALQGRERVFRRNFIYLVGHHRVEIIRRLEHVFHEAETAVLRSRLRLIDGDDLADRLAGLGFDE
jgi:hypothetical protein